MYCVRYVLQCKGCLKKCTYRFCVKMGINMKNYDKIDPPKTPLNFQKIILKIIFFLKIAPKNPKKDPKNGPKMKKMIKEGRKHFFS